MVQLRVWAKITAISSIRAVYEMISDALCNDLQAGSDISSSRRYFSSEVIGVDL